MDRDYTSQKILELCIRSKEQYKVDIEVIEPTEFVKFCLNRIEDNKTEPKSKVAENREYLKGLVDEMSNYTASFCTPYDNPLIMIHLNLFNIWQDLGGEDYSDENFIEAVELTLKHEIGHFLHWKQNSKKYYACLEKVIMPEMPKNLIFKSIYGEELRKYYDNESERTANELGKVDIEKHIHYANILSRCSEIQRTDKAFSWKNLGKNFGSIKNTIGDDKFKIANCIYKMQRLPIAKKNCQEVLNYLINNYEDLSNLEVED